MPNYGGTQTLNNRLSSTSIVPIGTVLAWSGNSSASLPNGFILCDGYPYMASLYPRLYAIIGTFHGDGTFTANGAASGLPAGAKFNVPDYRGRFLRGIDNMGTGARGSDDLTVRTRTAANNGGTGTATGVGSKEVDQFQGHWHDARGAIELSGSAHGNYNHVGGVGPANSGNTGRDIVADTSGHGTPQVSSETRPMNSAVLFIIRAY